MYYEMKLEKIVSLINFNKDRTLKKTNSQNNMHNSYNIADMEAANNG